MKIKSVKCDKCELGSIYVGPPNLLELCDECGGTGEVKQVPVVFRRFADQVVALFPTTPFDLYYGHCQSYESFGKYGAAEIDSCITDSKPATPEQYKFIEKELESLGYHIAVYKRVQPWMKAELAVAIQEAREKAVVTV